MQENRYPTIQENGYQVHCEHGWQLHAYRNDNRVVGATSHELPQSSFWCETIVEGWRIHWNSHQLCLRNNSHFRSDKRKGCWIHRSRSRVIWTISYTLPMQSEIAWQWEEEEKSAVNEERSIRVVQKFIPVVPHRQSPVQQGEGEARAVPRRLHVRD